jgi:hypothetical protein
MSKELPFFKFNATEWITGNISYESFELQGAFISVCAEYWNRNNTLTIEEAKLRLRNSELIEKLIEKNYLKTKKTFLVISFLDLERKEISAKRLKLSESGRKGGLSKAKATLKQGSSIIEVDKDKEIDSIKDRKQKFASSLVPFVELYGKELVRQFYEYWTEHGPKDKKMRFEKQTSFNLELRIKRWNQKQVDAKKPIYKQPAPIWE